MCSQFHPAYSDILKITIFNWISTLCFYKHIMGASWTIYTVVISLLIWIYGVDEKRVDPGQLASDEAS